MRKLIGFIIVAVMAMTASAVPASAATPTIIAGSGPTYFAVYGNGPAQVSKPLVTVATVGSRGLMAANGAFAQPRMVSCTASAKVGGRTVYLILVQPDGVRMIFMFIIEGGKQYVSYAEVFDYPDLLSYHGNGPCGLALDFHNLNVSDNPGAPEAVPASQFVAVGG